MHTHAERGHDQPQPPLAKSKNASVLTDPFPAKAGPTKKHRVHLRDLRRPVGPASAGKRLICFNAFIFVHKKSKHRKTRLGCRLNAGLAQWAEPHGCGESAVRTWMSVRRGPTERDRSEGTRRSRAQPGAKRFWLLLGRFCQK